MWLAQVQTNAWVLVPSGVSIFGGLGWVLRIIWKYQKDVVDRYSVRIAEAEGETKVLKEERDLTRRQLMECALERGALRAMVRQAGLEWNPEDWGARPGD